MSNSTKMSKTKKIKQFKIPQLTKAPPKQGKQSRDTFLETIVIYWSNHSSSWIAATVRTGLLCSGESVENSYENIEKMFMDHLDVCTALKDKIKFFHKCQDKILELYQIAMPLWTKRNNELEDNKKVVYKDYLTYLATKPEYIEFVKLLNKKD